MNVNIRLIRICCLAVLSPALISGVFPARALPQTVEDRITATINLMSTAEKIDQLHQQGGFNTADNTRLGIPGFIMSDGPHGVRDGMATSFPVGIGMASTWDVGLALRVGTAMGEEFRGKGKSQALGPCLDIDRDPRNGRSPETGGEDPYLCAQITSAVVRGIQSTGCIATVKHYNANHRENGRTTNNIIASERVLHEDAGLAFRTAVQRGGAFSVMNAYNLINGQQCAESPDLLTTILRTHWGFPYYVVSDWGSIVNSEKAIKAGCNICMGSTKYATDLPGLVAGGTIPMAVIDSAVRCVLRTKIMAGMLDYIPAGTSVNINSPAHQALCRDAGRESLVLLRNQGGLLPLDGTAATRIALIGPSAAVAQIDGSGSAYVTPFYTVSPKQGIETVVGAQKVSYTKGCDINSADTSGFASALALASGADAVVYCGGLDPSQEGEGFDRVGGSTELPGKQQDLINRLASVNPRLIVVLFSGGICGLSRSIDNIPALLYAFYPGQEGGTAVSEVLFGLYNPGGKLPVTMPRSDSQLPPWNDNLNDDYGCGYRWYDNMGYTPLFAFGSGLSYTTFSYSNFIITPSSAAPGVPVQVSLDVTNSGQRSGDEVVELYVTDNGTSVPMPVKALKGFSRITLSAGETRTVTFTLSADELYYWNESTNTYEVDRAHYTVRAGGSSDILPLSGTFTVTDGPGRPDLLITGLRTVPPYPFPGQNVVFLATVKNQGSASFPGGAPVNVAFSVNGREVCRSTGFTGPIPAGGMALLCSDGGPGGVNYWKSDSVGTYMIGGIVDPDNTIDECVETNNAATASLDVSSRPAANLALNKTVLVTSVEAAGYEGTMAVDGNMGTRWSSQFTDPQAITVDLGSLCYVDNVVLYWEAAYGKEYYVRISDGVSGWTDLYHETAGIGGMKSIHVGANARQVMMQGIQRGTVYGYSLYEFEIHGSPVASLGPRSGDNSLPKQFLLSDGFPNPFNPSATIRFELPVASTVSIIVYDLLGREVQRLAEGMHQPGYHEVKFESAGAASGTYFCRMSAEPAGGGRSFVSVKKLMVLR
jgi:beta-glucosidase